MNRTAVTLIFALIMMFVLGMWILITLLLHARRDAAVDKLVLTSAIDPVNDDASGEQALVQRIQKIRTSAREHHVLVGCLAALLLAAVSMGYFTITTFTTLAGI